MNSMLLVVSHKPFKCPNIGGYKPIYVGPKKFEINRYAFRDDSGDSIAEKNPNYCELTALYWFWKNNELHYDYVGLCHYRRYFSKFGITKSPHFYLTNHDIEKMMEDHEVILPTRRKIGCSVAENYYVKGHGKKRDLDSLIKIVGELYPEYVNDFKSTLLMNELSYCNMFVMSYSNYCSYCQWLFDLLFKLEEVTDLTDYTPAEARIYGYLSEILLNVWVQKNKLKVKYCDIIQSDISSVLQMKLYIKSKLK